MEPEIQDDTTVNNIEATAISQDLQERYTHWKKNTRLLYDYLNTNSTKWPSLSCQFFQDVNTKNDSHRILLSSFTSGLMPEQESINIMSISTLKHVPWASLNNFDMDEMEFKPDNNLKLPPKNLHTEQTITFPNGDCNRARYLPQNQDIIAGASSDGTVYIFNRTKYGSTLRQTSSFQSYQARFAEPENTVQSVDSNPNEALSIDWNVQREGLLAASYSDGEIKTWDLKKFSNANTTITTPTVSIMMDTNGANDVTWMPLHDSLLAACGESNKLIIYDIRGSREHTTISSGIHEDGINACRFNYANNLIVASADTVGNVHIWDIRKSNEIVKTIPHGSSISTIEWNPNMDTILATAGQDDGLVKLWDVTDSELIFTHGGHMLGVNDISWNRHDPWLMCSVARDNSVQIWRPAHNLVEEQV
ncbi:hypothetical protein TPHA_0L01720 [Tetrapisispora phaffii CBS 4417]|uniref:Uncharacterized protein n=1 Tax=Tetrapisispora phaffii (strain ATCC 24235 / CBS 4417 / NBRC 1672 / NRRL Y-8282 / UCD 70-5) TaxID=1071381 RepID=G8C047_TETPH|nr:hypothetical protein TPHA_0L01720 [Tetrapisispora phaffii CBS 4417]CCE65525.1 hypothetical protein TPHA_0L01720 [Tetrapisispora phaffii CBS 4417]